MDAELRTSIDRLRESVDALRQTLEATAAADLGTGGDGDLRHRLQVLAQLQQEGLISEDEYSERKDLLLRDWDR